MGKPPALPGRLTEFDIFGSIRKPPSCEPLKVNREESFRMDEYQSLSHTAWDCKYHVVWIPKYRRKALYEQLRKHLGQVFRELARQKESKVLEGHLMVDHVHMLISIPPKYGVSQVVGYIKGKSAIHIARTFLGRKKNFTGQSFWARGYFVSTVGRDEQTIRQYIKKQEAEDRRLDQLNMFM
jgi:putative transposase